MTSPGPARSSPGPRPAAHRYEINNRDPSRLTQAPPMIRTLGTEFGHFFLLEQDSEVTPIDAGLSRYRDTLEAALSVFDRGLRNPGLPIRQA